jgi:hypothetical protein
VVCNHLPGTAPHSTRVFWAINAQAICAAGRMIYKTMIKSLSHSKNAPEMIHRTARNKIRHILRALKENPDQPNLQERLRYWESK